MKIMKHLFVARTFIRYLTTRGINSSETRSFVCPFPKTSYRSDFHRDVFVSHGA
jgi:hypothetical protein